MSEKEQKQESPIGTYCNKCIFARHEELKTDSMDSKDLITRQNGCSLRLLPVFERNGGDLVEFADEDGNEFYGIANRVCVFYRNNA
jgi:hypothetical protein